MNKSFRALLSSFGPCVYVLHSHENISQSEVRYGVSTTSLGQRMVQHISTQVSTQVYFRQNNDNDVRWAYVTVISIENLINQTQNKHLKSQKVSKLLIQLKQLVILLFHCNINRVQVISSASNGKMVYMYIYNNTKYNSSIYFQVLVQHKI